MAQFLHILWNAHLLKDLRLNIINGVRLLNFEHKSLSCPRTKIPRMKTCIISSSKRTGAGVGLAFDFSKPWEAASFVLCSAESLVFVESGNEIPENAMALACSAAICGVPVHLSN